MMNSTFTALLADPAAVIEIDEFSFTGLLESFDTENADLRDFRRMQSALSRFTDTVDVVEAAAAEGLYHHDPDFEAFIGMESAEIAQFVIDAIKAIFKMIYNFVAGILRFIKNMIKKIFHIDSKLNSYSDSKADTLARRVSGQAKHTGAAEEWMRQQLIKQMCSKDEFLHMIDDIEHIHTEAEAFVTKEIGAQIHSLDKAVSSQKTLSSILTTPDFKQRFDRLGITLDEKKVQFKSPFSGLKEVSMESLHFGKMTDILEINRVYSSKKFAGSYIWVALEKSLEQFQKNLAQKEKELTTSATVDRMTLKENAKLIQKEISFAVHVVSGLRQISNALNFRRKELCDKGIAAYKRVSTKRQGE